MTITELLLPEFDQEMASDAARARTRARRQVQLETA